MKRRRQPAPILSPDFVWHGSQTHDAGSDAFRARQRARIVKAQAYAKPAENVAQLNKRKA